MNLFDELDYGFGDHDLDESEMAAMESIIAIEGIHPIQATISATSQLATVLNGIGWIANDAIYGIEVYVSLAINSFFEKHMYNTRIRDLKKKAEKCDDEKKKAKLLDKAKRAEKIRDLTHGIVSKTPFAETLNKPNLMDKAISFFEETDVSIKEGHAARFEKQAKKHENAGQKGTAAIAKRQAEYIRSGIKESATYGGILDMMDEDDSYAAMEASFEEDISAYDDYESDDFDPFEDLF